MRPLGRKEERGLGTSLDFGTVSALTWQSPGGHHQGRGEVALPESSTPGRDQGKGGWRLLTPRRGDPFSHWPRWGMCLLEEDVGHQGDGFFIPCSCSGPPEARRYCPGLSWFPPATHTPSGPAYRRRDFGFCCRDRDACTRQESPARPSVPSGQGLAGQGSLCPAESGPSCLFFLRPPLAPGLFPAGPPLGQKEASCGEGASCSFSPGTSASPAPCPRGCPEMPWTAGAPRGVGPAWINTAGEGEPAVGPCPLLTSLALGRAAPQRRRVH